MSAKCGIVAFIYLYIMLNEENAVFTGLVLIFVFHIDIIVPFLGIVNPKIGTFNIIFLMNTVFGKKLKELRTEKNLTQLQAAEIFSVSKTTICQWETSRQEASLDDVVKIALYFDVSSDYLLGLEDETGTKIKPD